jgi:hypothetical protein
VFLEFKWPLPSGEARKPSREPFVSSENPETIVAEAADMCQSPPRSGSAGGHWRHGAVIQYGRAVKGRVRFSDKESVLSFHSDNDGQPPG